MKAPCEPKWSDSSTQDVKFCIMFNIMLVFIKKSITQSVLDDVKDEKAKWMRPGGDNRASLLISIYNKNTHGTRASDFVAKLNPYLQKLRTLDTKSVK